jgi:hypothetical protein
MLVPSSLPLFANGRHVRARRDQSGVIDDVAWMKVLTCCLSNRLQLPTYSRALFPLELNQYFPTFFVTRRHIIQRNNFVLYGHYTCFSGQFYRRQRNDFPDFRNQRRLLAFENLILPRYAEPTSMIWNSIKVFMDQLYSRSSWNRSRSF